ncbi:MAG: flavodoxin family protein [Armatimonadota bacterium]
MKILVMQASPNLDGLTATMAKEALAGAQAAGAEAELLNLRKLKLGACLACDDGWGKCRRESLCIIEDDLEMVRGKMAESDGVVLSTPVYFGEVAEIMKNFLDRLRRCERAGPADPRVEGVRVMNIAAAGGGGGGGPSCLVVMERYCAHMGLPIFDQMIVTRRSRDYMVAAAREAGEAFVKYIEDQQQS